MSIFKRILITPGEPAGVGPDITIRLAQQSWPVELVAIADPTVLAERAALLNLPLRLIETDCSDLPRPQQAGTLTILPLRASVQTLAGKLNPANAGYVVQTLEKAVSLCLQKIADAVVTGPVHKAIINQAGIPFRGHTEFFAQLAHVKHTVMLFVVDTLKVALVTTHLPLAEVPKAITKAILHSTLSIVDAALKTQFNLASPRVLVCGLNPHAGEGGYLGREEIDTIAPVLEAWRQQNHHVEGPLPADTVFTPHYLEKADAIVAMYHDQGLPIVKYIGFGHAVNMTLGLPFIRTSVDHGTAIDLAGSDRVDTGSMRAALLLAIKIVSAPPSSNA